VIFAHTEKKNPFSHNETQKCSASALSLAKELCHAHRPLSCLAPSRQAALLKNAAMANLMSLRVDQQPVSLSPLLSSLWP